MRLMAALSPKRTRKSEWKWVAARLWGLACKAAAPPLLCCAQVRPHCACAAALCHAAMVVGYIIYRPKAQASKQHANPWEQPQ